MNEKLTATIPSAQPVTIPLHNNCSASIAAIRSVAAHLLDGDVLAAFHHVDIQRYGRCVALELQWNQPLEFSDRKQRVMYVLAAQRLALRQPFVPVNHV